MTRTFHCSVCHTRHSWTLPQADARELPRHDWLSLVADVALALVAFAGVAVGLLWLLAAAA